MDGNEKRVVEVVTHADEVGDVDQGGPQAKVFCDLFIMRRDCQVKMTLVTLTFSLAGCCLLLLHALL